MTRTQVLLFTVLLALTLSLGLVVGYKVADNRDYNLITLSDFVESRATTSCRDEIGTAASGHYNIPTSLVTGAGHRFYVQGMIGWSDDHDRGVDKWFSYKCTAQFSDDFSTLTTGVDMKEATRPA